MCGRNAARLPPTLGRGATVGGGRRARNERRETSATGSYPARGNDRLPAASAKDHWSPSPAQARFPNCRRTWAEARPRRAFDDSLKSIGAISQRVVFSDSRSSRGVAIGLKIRPHVRSRDRRQRCNGPTTLAQRPEQGHRNPLGFWGTADTNGTSLSLFRIGNYVQRQIETFRFVFWKKPFFFFIKNQMQNYELCSIKKSNKKFVSFGFSIIIRSVMCLLPMIWCQVRHVASSWFKSISIFFRAFSIIQKKKQKRKYEINYDHC